MSSSRVTVACAQYVIDRLASWAAYAAKQERWVLDAVEQGAELLMFPEYAGLELLGLVPEAKRLSLAEELRQLQAWLGDYEGLMGELAVRYGVWLLAGSLPVWRSAVAGYCNEALLYSPTGERFVFGKRMMTRFEAEDWLITASPHAPEPVNSPWGKLSVAICYDSEFPLVVRHSTAQGATLLLVPSCTETLAGYYRVRVGARARALENQCYVAQAVLVGRVDWLAAVDVNVGRAGVYGPIDSALSETGVLAQGTMNAPGWVLATLSMEALEAIRTQGQVLNARDWRDRPFESI